MPLDGKFNEWRRRGEQVQEDETARRTLNNWIKQVQIMG